MVLRERVRQLWQTSFGKWDRVTVAAVLLALVAWLTIALAERHNSPTCDEYRHVTRGVAALRAPDTRINFPHPPLAQALAMLPVALTTNPRLQDLSGWPRASMVRVTSGYIKTDYEKGRGYLRAGRLMNAAWSSALLVFLVLWLRRQFGDVTALAAGALYATCPIILAHAGLVTNDFALGAFTVLALAAVLAYLDRGAWWRLLLAALAVAALPISKVSGLVVMLSLMPLPLWWLARRRGVYESGRWSGAVLRLLRDYAVIALTVLLAVNVIYRFHHSFLTPRELASVSYVDPAFVADHDYSLPFFDHWPSNWRVPLPKGFLDSVDVIRAKNEKGHSGPWFGGRSRAGSALYFPFMLLAKPQALLLPLLLAGFVLGPRQMLKGAGKWLLFVGLAFLGMAMTSSINIGVRHISPTIICLLALGGRAAAVVLGVVQRRAPRLRTPLAAVGGAALLGGVALAFPAFVGDFNLLVGNELGRQAGAVAEDWGQDGAPLAAALKQRGIRRVAYSPRHSYGILEQENEGISVRRLGCRSKPGKHAMAVHLASWQRSKRCYRALRKLEPDFVVNHNVLVFLPRSDDAAPPKRSRRRKPAAAEPAPQTEQTRAEAGEGGDANEPEKPGETAEGEPDE